jgi:hypothetical protein
MNLENEPVPVAVLRLRMVLDRSKTGSVGSNPNRGMDMSAFFYVVLSYIGRCPMTSRSHVQGGLSKCLKGFTVTEI